MEEEEEERECQTEYPATPLVDGWDAFRLSFSLWSKIGDDQMSCNETEGLRTTGFESSLWPQFHV